MKATYGTGVFVLAHVGDRAAGPARRPAADRRLARRTGTVEWALDGGVFTAGALLDWLSRDLGLAADPPRARGARPHAVEDAGGVRVLPALAGPGRAVVAARRPRRASPG